MSDQTSETLESPEDCPELPVWFFLAAWIVLTLTRTIRQENERLLEKHRQMEGLLSIDEVADVLGVSKRTVEDIVGRDRLQPIWVKGQRRFHPDAVDAYLRRKAQNNG